MQPSPTRALARHVGGRVHHARRPPAVRGQQRPVGEPVAARADHRGRAAGGQVVRRAHRQPVDLGADPGRVLQLDQPGDLEAGVACVLDDLEREASGAGYVDVA